MIGDEWVAAFGKAVTLALVSIAGILMRHAHAAATTGQVQWRLFLIACLTAPAMGVIAGGLAEWMGASGMLLWAIVATIGFLGPPFIHATALTISGKLLKKIPR